MARGQLVRRDACGGLAAWQIELSRALLLRDLSVDLPVARLASVCGLSRSHFAKAFKVSMGSPPHHWLTRQRIDRACTLLLGANARISAVAQECGFADQSHFTRTFRSLVGCSPGAWRRRRRAVLN